MALGAQRGHVLLQVLRQGLKLSLLGVTMGLVVHGMQGFDYDRAQKELGVPEDHQVEAMAAVGRPGDAEDLPQTLQEREKPSQRKNVEEFAFEGGFGTGK